ncbi:hypothetical protein Goshw_010845 [Gossypium schwendimanii]|uniref:Ribosomal protein S11 n=1 Tax=Gossypium schwendimanii TaxID=34291 RepID=A0A7J9LFA3_GOSSC|nr:hypothetical protein [Gossypium schwendimanii]
MHIEYQKELFMFKQVSTIPLLLLQNVLGRVISWSSAGTCGFEGTRRGTSFAAQTAAGNAIRAVVDQGMRLKNENLLVV